MTRRFMHPRRTAPTPAGNATAGVVRRSHAGFQGRTAWLLPLWAAACLSMNSTASAARLEQEQLLLENQIQERIEGILSKTLPANSYLVTVKVDMENRTVPRTVDRAARREQTNPFLDRSQFMLPGVPQTKEFVQPPAQDNGDTNITLESAETLIRRISITVLVSPDVSSEQIRAMRDIISASIPFNPLRGDEMDIRPSPLLKKSTDNGASAPQVNSAAAEAPTPEAPTSFVQGLFGPHPPASLLIVAGAAAMALIIFVAFLFGPVRAFLNRLLTVLPRVGEQAAYAVSNASKPAAQTPAAGLPGYPGGSTNGGGNRHNGVDLPFQFIREDQLSKLPILFKQMPPMQSALVVAYLPPEWASRLLSMLEPNLQSQVMSELSTAREVPAEAVKEIESQIKSKLPYLVGGVDWVQSVYQLTQPETQRTLLGSLNQQAPELAQSLRKRTFFFEDIATLAPGALRLLVQEIGYPTAAMALKDERPELRDALLRKLPAATREIIQQELELSAEDRAGSQEAKSRFVVLARRLMAEGRIAMPERK